MKWRTTTTTTCEGYGRTDGGNDDGNNSTIGLHEVHCSIAREGKCR